jgi:hypothetical protein
VFRSRLGSRWQWPNISDRARFISDEQLRVGGVPAGPPAAHSGGRSELTATRSSAFEFFRLIRSSDRVSPAAKLLWEHYLDRRSEDKLAWPGTEDCARALGRPGQARSIRRLKRELERIGALVPAGYRSNGQARTRQYYVPDPAEILGPTGHKRPVGEPDKNVRLADSNRTRMTGSNTGEPDISGHRTGQKWPPNSP